MKIEELLHDATKKLKENNIDDSISKARRLLAFVLNVSKQYLIINNNIEVSQENTEKVNTFIDELIQGKPIQYITNKQEFYGIDFYVDENVLIPQPDTEILVEETIKIAQTINKPEILDLCTGSGAIAVSLAENLPEATITASDISLKALNIAKKNEKHKKIEFIESNLFENIENKFDIIVSNPPYIKTEEINELSKEVQNEPKLALDGGKDGLEFYRKIIGQACTYLKPNGYLCLEIGEDQREEVIELIKQTGNYINIQAFKDISGNDRVITCKMQ